MCRWVRIGLVLVAGCHYVFGVRGADDEPPTDAMTDAAPDGGKDARVPCDAWFEPEPIRSGVGDFAPTGIGAGFFDEDTERDLVLTSSRAGIHIARASGNGKFEAAELRASSMGIVPDNFAIADFDADADSDIVVGSTSGLVEVYRFQNGVATPTAFQAATTQSRVVPVAVEYDGDGRLDIAVARPPSSQIQFYTQLPNAFAFTASDVFATGTQPRVILPVELDTSAPGTELVTANLAGNSISLYRYGDVDTLDIITAPRWITSGRVDADDIADVAFSTANGNIDVIWGTATGDLSKLDPPITVSATVAGIALADLEGDHRAELLVFDRNAAILHIIGALDSNPPTPEAMPIPANTAAMVVDDFTGDTLPDLVIVTDAGEVQLYPNCR